MMENVANRIEYTQQATGASPAVRQRGVRVWDLPTRLFHWLLLVCIAAAVACAQVGGNWTEWHVRFGAAALGLLAFRLIWGVVGPRYARFKSFLYSPRVMLAALKRLFADSQRHPGHSPTGALSVFALLGVLVIQAVSGLFSSDSISTDGPLVHLVGETTVSLATTLHKSLQWALYGLVALHVVAVLGYVLIKKDDLIGAMVHGDKQGIHAAAASDSAVIRVAGLGLMAACVSASLWLFAG